MDNNVGSNGNGGSAYRFRRIPRHSLPHLKLDSLLDENLDHLPHLSELVQCYRSDWIKDDNKYGHYESISPVSFQNQIFEGPDTDIETEMKLASARQIKAEDATDDDIPSSSGRQFTNSNVTKHFGQSPLPAYEPAFDWGNERSMIFGQRIPETPTTQYGSGLKISVKVLSLSFQAGLVEPFYGTICIYNRERREKLSEDFYFCVLPSEMQDAKVPLEPHGIFYLDVPSASVCLLIQLEKPATEEGGVNPSVYSRKEPVHLTERERQKLQVWSRIMPYRESFAWAIVPLFDNSIAAASGGSASPSSPLAPNMSGSSSHEGVFEPIAKITSDGKLGYSSGSSVIVEISNLNKVKESYTEDSLQDPKRKVHKPVKGVLKLEIEKHQTVYTELENVSESGSVTNDSLDQGDSIADMMFPKSPGKPQSGNSKWITIDGKDVSGNGSKTQGNLDFCADDCQTFDFHTTMRNEPFLQLFHYLYVYPLTVSLSRKRNLFIRVELRKDDADARRQPLEAMHLRERGSSLQRCVHTQVAVGTRVACYHDEIKVSLPAVWTPLHHLLFTFFHVDLQTKLEAPKPVVIGYASLPLSTHAQRGWIIWKMEKVFCKLCLRLCSSVYLINERIRDFFLEYDRHTLRTSPPWGSELLEAKGYRVGPVYGDVLAMAWFFLELIVKSMALEQTHLFLSVFH